MLIKYGINKKSIIFFFNSNDGQEILKFFENENFLMPCVFYDREKYFHIDLNIHIDNHQEHLTLSNEKVNLAIDDETKEYLIYLINFFNTNNYFPVAECCEVLNTKTNKNMQIYFQNIDESNL